MKQYFLLLAFLFAGIAFYGQIHKIDTSFYSESLNKTMLVDVYLPPGYNGNPDLKYPVIYYLHAWGGNQNEMGNSILSLVEKYINDSIIDPVIMVCAENCPPPFDGTMYVNSMLWGNYEDYMMKDLVNWIETSYRAFPDRNYRGLMGHSMGGYGSFRYGILHKEDFRALAAHAGIFPCDSALWFEPASQKIRQECQPGPPFLYNFTTGGLFTRGAFLMAGAFSPDSNSSQTYINPRIVEYVFDENADYIDSIATLWKEDDILTIIHQLSPTDSVGVYFGCGTYDELLLYPGNLALKDTLDLLGLPYEFYSHNGTHVMPVAFKRRALVFLDSLLMPPIYITATDNRHFSSGDRFLRIYPNPVKTSATIQIDMPHEGVAKLVLLNYLGQQIEIILERNLQKGIQHTMYDVSGLPPGVYLLRLQTGGRTVVKRLLNIRIP